MDITKHCHGMPNLYHQFEVVYEYKMYTSDGCVLGEDTLKFVPITQHLRCRICGYSVDRLKEERKED